MTHQRIAVDTETTGLNPWVGDRPFAVSMCTVDDNEETFFWEWDVDPFTREVLVCEKDKREIQKKLDEASESTDFWNAKFDVLMLEHIDISVKWPIGTKELHVHEVSYMARACFNLELAFALKPLAKKYVNIPNDDEKALHDSVKKARRIAKKLGWAVADDWHADYWIPAALWKHHPEIAEEKGILKGANKKYAITDAVRTARLSRFYEYGMHELGESVWDTYRMEMRLLPYSIDMERQGVCIDGNRIRKVRKECAIKARDALKVLVDATGNKDFNSNSPKQVCDMLYGGHPLKLKPLGKTKGGADSTAAENLVPYRGEQLVESLLQYRTATKALNTFFKKYRELSDRDPNGNLILHPGFRQWGTLTGRYACAEPNLQAVSDPTNTNSRVADMVVDIRQTFMPPPGYRWYAPDYDQVEVIIFADVSGEETMLQAIREGRDIHSATANKVWGGSGNPRATKAVRRLLEFEAAMDHLNSDPELRKFVDMNREKAAGELIRLFDYDICALENALGQKTFRKLAKTVTFTKIFGGGYKALMGWLGIDANEANDILVDYTAAFPDIKDKQNEIERKGLDDGYYLNPYGRRLMVDRFSSYMLVNHVIQSAAADLIKRGMIRCADYLRNSGLDARIVMTIHDEIIFQIREEHCYKKVLRKLCYMMSDHGGVFSVPTPCSMERITERWSMKEKAAI